MQFTGNYNLLTGGKGSQVSTSVVPVSSGSPSKQSIAINSLPLYAIPSPYSKITIQQYMIIIHVM